MKWPGKAFPKAFFKDKTWKRWEGDDDGGSKNLLSFSPG